jgi:hypothetical protein
MITDQVPSSGKNLVSAPPLRHGLFVPVPIAVPFRFPLALMYA